MPSATARAIAAVLPHRDSYTTTAFIECTSLVVHKLRVNHPFQDDGLSLDAAQRPRIEPLGGSGNGPPILAQSGGQRFSSFPHASRVSCSELLGGFGHRATPM
jgi:hypothetical protein